MRARIRAALLVAVLAAVPAAAQQDRPDYRRAIAAGYKASFLCSDLFNAGLPEPVIERDDFQRIYPEVEPLLAGLPAEIDREHRRIMVRYADDMPPRVAQWRPSLGCAQLPIGAPIADADKLPQLRQHPAGLAKTDARPWPDGDLILGNTVLRPPLGAAVNRVVEKAFDRRTYGQGTETTALLVVWQGRIVAERYRSDFDLHTSQRTWSAAKSIAATLIGAAVQDGLLDPAKPANVPEWQRPGDPRRTITTDLLLRMNSGLNSDFAGNRTDALYFGGMSVSDTLASLPLVARSGHRFRYSNNDIVAAVRGLSHTLGDGERALNYPFERLLWRIGMTRTLPETDWQGQFVISSQVWTTARDLARLGLLYLNDGTWNGARVLPPRWTDYVRRHGAAQPERGFGYGAGWWTFPADSGLPADAIVAQGNRGQYLVVIPSRQLVLVRRGFDGSPNLDIAALTRDLLAALDARP